MIDLVQLQMLPEEEEAGFIACCENSDLNSNPFTEKSYTCCIDEFTSV